MSEKKNKKYFKRFDPKKPKSKQLNYLRRYHSECFDELLLSSGYAKFELEIKYKSPKINQLLCDAYFEISSELDPSSQIDNTIQLLRGKTTTTDNWQTLITQCVRGRGKSLNQMQK